MYCSSCGKAVDQRVSYCTRCGARANEATGYAASKLSESSFNLLVAGILGVPIAGLGIVIGLMSVMKEMGFSQTLIIAFASLGILLLLATETMFIWLLLQNRIRADKETGNSLQDVEIKELGEAQAAELSEPMPHVTEHTTRSFEVVHREPKMR